MFKKFITLSLITSTSLFAAAYKIPEQSLNSTALAAAYVANANGADSAYYNPANMVFASESNQFELSTIFIHLPEIDFEATNPAFSGDSKSESFVVPTFFYIFPSENENLKYGLSFVAPGGLAKRWDEAAQKAFAEHFELKIMEFNPTIGYKINDQLSIGAGLRFIYSEGTVKSDATVAARDMQGDTVELGYNLALTYKPLEDTTFAMTYRSNIDIKEEGNAKLYLGGTLVYNGDASVEVPLPAGLNLSLAQKFEDLTVELNVERTFWSKYKNLDFQYASPIHPALVASFDDPVVKNYKDTNTYRLGLTYDYSQDLKLMGAFALDYSPVPDTTIGYDLPDSDSKNYSFGFNYKINEQSHFGAAYLYSDREDRDVNISGTTGTFKNSEAHLLTFGYSYRF